MCYNAQLISPETNGFYLLYFNSLTHTFLNNGLSYRILFSSDVPLRQEVMETVLIDILGTDSELNIAAYKTLPYINASVLEDKVKSNALSIRAYWAPSLESKPAAVYYLYH